MKKRSISILCMLLALLLALPAGAEPIVSGAAGYTAYLGENNYLYLTDPSGVTKVLQTPIANLIGMTDTALYCTTADGRRYEVLLDGSASRIMTEEPAVSTAYFLRESILSPMDAAGVELSGIPDVVAACATADALYYVAANSLSGYALMRLPLPAEESTIASGKVLVCAQVSKPVSIAASPEAITIVTEQQTVQVIDLVSGLKDTVAFYGTDLTHAVAFDGKLIALSANESGQYTVLESRDYTAPSPLMLTAMTTPEPTAPAKLSATATPKPTVTPKPTNKPVEEDDGRIYRGETGSAVRKMQRRLLELGYPVGKVDGDFGENTLLAVNLFQCAIGYRNRNYASDAMLNKLYSKKAPAYDPYAPLKEGDEGADVEIMQTFLVALGYSVGEKGIDGKFGKDTKAAVEQFQLVAGLEVTGEADAETLKLLYDEENPIPNATPTPVPPTEAPTDEPTQAPTEAPTGEPTQAPTEAPTDEPTQAPTEAPTDEPTQAPTEAPTDEPTQAPTEAPTQEPATSTDL